MFYIIILGVPEKLHEVFHHVLNFEPFVSESRCLHQNARQVCYLQITLFQTLYFKLSTIGGRAFPVAASQITELTTRHSRFGINPAVVPAPIENFFISTILYLLAL